MSRYHTIGLLVGMMDGTAPGLPALALAWPVETGAGAVVGIEPWVAPPVMGYGERR